MTVEKVARAEGRPQWNDKVRGGRGTENGAEFEDEREGGYGVLDGR